MHATANGVGIVLQAPAKLNLFFEILGRRPDGYHDVETLMCPVSVYDTLYFRPTRSPGVKLTLSRDRGSHRQEAESVPEGSSNLVSRALHLLGSRSGVEPSIAVHLHKRIPAAAGLGGGSSDAAAALNAANRLWNLGWPARKLAEVAAELGSDVPFFLSARSAICRGRGELMETLRHSGRFCAVVACPSESMSTRVAYENCRVPPHPRDVADAVTAVAMSSWRDIPSAFFNRLEETVVELTDSIRRLREEFARLGFVFHQMSGSGTSYFGICRSAGHARRLAAELRSRQVGQVFAVQSCG